MNLEKEVFLTQNQKENEMTDFKENRLTLNNMVIVVILTLIATFVFFSVVGFLPNTLMGGKAEILLPKSRCEDVFQDFNSEKVINHKIEIRANRAGFTFAKSLDVSVSE
jgi:cell shape-determining protein MreC